MKNTIKNNLVVAADLEAEDEDCEEDEESKFSTSELEDIIAKHKMNIRYCRDGESFHVYCDEDPYKGYRLD